MTEYNIEFTTTIVVEAEDAIDAVEKAKEQVSIDDLCIYVDGNMY